MVAYVITYLEVTDPQAFQAYRQAAGPTFAPYGGKPVVVDGAFEVLEGMIQPRSVVVVEFESMEQARRWYASPEYAKTIPMRQQAANASLILVEGVARPRELRIEEIDMDMQAAVFRKVHEPLTIESVEIDKPWGREVLVRTVATGVCHSDLHVVDGLGRYALDRPFVLGHEGAGVVEAVGADVTVVKPGDHVVACLSGFCGSCPQCLSGHPNLCVGGLVTRAAWAAPRLSQRGQGFQQFAGIGSYAERMLLHENSLVKIDAELPLDRAALVGCGVLTGVGAALRTSGLQGGQTVAVFGCGGVGLAIVQGARIGGASRIIGVDMFDSKLEMARRVGATHVVNSTTDDPVKAIRAFTGGAGVDHAFEAVGNTKLVRQAIESLAIRGTATIVGVLPPDAMIEFPWMAIRPECRVQTSRMGSNQFRTDIPRYLEFYRQGRLLLDEMVTRRGRLDDINEAFRAMKAGEVARTVLTFE